MKDFIEYTGSYDKQFYDVLKDGVVYPQIWPNAGRWMRGGIELCSDENRTRIHILPSPIHPAEVRMEYTMTPTAYQRTRDDREGYIAERRPIAEAEYQEWERERKEKEEKERKEFLSLYDCIVDGDHWELRRKDTYTPHTDKRPNLSKEERTKLRKKKKQIRKTLKLKRRRNKR